MILQMKIQAVFFLSKLRWGSLFNFLVLAIAFTKREASSFLLVPMLCEAVVEASHYITYCIIFIRVESAHPQNAPKHV